MILLWIAAIVVGIYILVTGFFFVFQSRFIYLPERVLQGDPSRVGLPFEDVSLKTSDGVRLSAWFVPNQDSRGVLLLCHGNGSNMGHQHRLELLRLFHGLGLEVLVFDYRGYGESEGRPTEKGTYEDAEAAWRYLIDERGVRPEKVVLIGRSLGGSIAAWLASRHTPGALIVESAFTSLPDAAATHFPYLPVRLIARFRYDTAKFLAEVKCPILIIHSRNDEVNPFSHGKRLYEIAPGPKSFLELAGTHNDGFIASRTVYEQGLDAFISHHLGPRR